MRKKRKNKKKKKKGGRESGICVYFTILVFSILANEDLMLRMRWMKFEMRMKFFFQFRPCDLQYS